MSKTAKLAVDYLSRHHLEKVHSSSDGYLFEKKQDALAHAKTLKDKNVKTHYRGKTESLKSEKQTDATLIDSSKKTEAPKNVVKKPKASEDQGKTEKPEDASKTGEAALQNGKSKPEK